MQRPTTNVLIVQAGGTIDKGYPEGKDDHGYSFIIEEPAAAQIITDCTRGGRKSHQLQYEAQVACQKDSLDMDDDDRKTVGDVIFDSYISSVIVTHGTDTIKQTAEHLAERLKDYLGDKRIVLTGAYKPAQFKKTDADFNIGYALAAVHASDVPGVFIALNGILTPWDMYEAD